MSNASTLACNMRVKIFVTRIQSSDYRDLDDVCISGTAEEAKDIYRSVLIEELVHSVAEDDFNDDEDAARAHLTAMSDDDLDALWQSGDRDFQADWYDCSISIPRPEGC